ncbi:MAG: hypothetical protein KDN18_23305 [Verrucomicrobiae bacterium]|nr:hypothetical protein [Verrucomicrobiae bacterium]
MRIFTLLCSLALGGVGASSYYGWEARGEAGPVLTAAIPAFVGGVMLIGVIIALLLRKTGLQIAFLAALIGTGLAVGRLLPNYLKEIFDPQDRFTTLMLAMGGVCLLYVVVSVVKFVFRKRPVRKEKKRKVTAVDQTDVEEAVAAG